MSSTTYTIEGGYSLSGEVNVGGSKNAALPLLAGSVCVRGVSVFRNVPDLRDIHSLIAILQFLGATVEYSNHTCTIDAVNMVSRPIPHDLVSKLRGSIVLLGPLLARFGTVSMAFPGGCVLGKRPIGAHLQVLSDLGAKYTGNEEVISFEGSLCNQSTVVAEFSVTATETALLAASMISHGVTTIELAALEPHVMDVVRFVESLGAIVSTPRPHTLVVTSPVTLRTSVEHTVIGDYLEAGALLLAGILTKGTVTVRGVSPHDLTSFVHLVRKTGAKLAVHDDAITASGYDVVLRSVNVQTNIFPGFPTDIQAPFGVLLTQATGVSRVFEVLFEGRMAYLYELEKMGAHIEILNAHQALIIGPSQLRGRVVQSHDIRAGCAMVLAGLIADGTTTVTDIQYIERGYECLPEMLQLLGARIQKNVSSSLI